MLDKEVIEKFKEFQEKTGKHQELYIDDVRFESKNVQKIFDSIRRGASPRPIKDFIVGNDFSEKKYNWLKIGDVTKSNIYLNKTSQYIDEKGKAKSVLGKKGDFLITNSMTVGVPIILNIDTCFHDGFLHLGFNDAMQKKYYNLYLYYYFTSYREKLILKSKDGIVKNLNIDIMKEVNVPIPKDLNNEYGSFEIQKAIVEFLEFWKENCTNFFREKVAKKKPIYEDIKRIVIQNTFKYDEFIVSCFDKFVKDKGYDLEFNDIEFIRVDIFNDEENIELIGSKKIGSHEELEKINDENGIPVYDASANILTYVDKEKYSNEVFQVLDEANPDISFASEGNSSAGTNFIIHRGEYFINNHRTVIQFTNRYYSKYIYYNIVNMKSKYGFKRGYIPSQKELKRLKVIISIPKALSSEYDSFIIQNIFVEFWEMIIEQIDDKLAIYQRMLELTDIIDRAFLYRTFSKIDWSKE